MQGATFIGKPKEETTGCVLIVGVILNGPCLCTRSPDFLVADISFDRSSEGMAGKFKSPDR